MNFSRVEAGKIEYNLRPIDLLQTMDAVVNMIRPLATAKSIELRIEDCPLDVIALADPPKTEQVIINLISNAVAFTESGGSITIGCGFAEDGVWIRVRDSGVGIAADKLDSIFEPFVQVGRTLTTSHRGTGLGLAISRDLAKGMGGDLTVTSKVGEGSAFTLWLPAP